MASAVCLLFFFQWGGSGNSCYQGVNVVAASNIDELVRITPPLFMQQNVQSLSCKLTNNIINN